MTAISAAIGLVSASAIQDPYLVWAFAGPTIAGGVCTVIFWFLFKHLDREEFVLNTDRIDAIQHSDSDEEDARRGDVVQNKAAGDVKIASKKI